MQTKRVVNQLQHLVTIVCLFFASLLLIPWLTWRWKYPWRMQMHWYGRLWRRRNILWVPCTASHGFMPWCAVSCTTPHFSNVKGTVQQHPCPAQQWSAALPSGGVTTTTYCNTQYVCAFYSQQAPVINHYYYYYGGYRRKRRSRGRGKRKGKGIVAKRN